MLFLSLEAKTRHPYLVTYGVAASQW